VRVCVSFYELFGLQAGRAPYTFPFSQNSFSLPCFLYIFSASSCLCWDKQKPSHPHTFVRRHFPFAHAFTHMQLHCPNPFDVAFIALACFFACSLCRKGSKKDFRVVQTVLPHLKLKCALVLYEFAGYRMVSKNRFGFWSFSFQLNIYFK